MSTRSLPPTRLRRVVATLSSLSVLTLGSGLGAPSVHAQGNEGAVPFDIGRVVIRGNSVGTLGARALLTSVDTLGGPALQDSAASGNWELLARLPGITLTNFNQGTTTGKPSMRGFNGEGEVNAVKLLIDGVPGNSNDGNLPYLDLVVPLAMQAITTVRGTNDARYGLHNIAGNFEVLTRQGGNATEARIGVGPWGRLDVQAVMDRESGGFSQNYAVGLRRNDGWRDHDSSERTTLSGQWAYAVPGQDLRISAALRLHRVEAEEAGYLNAADAAARPKTSYAISATDGGERTVSQATVAVEGGQRSRLAWRALAYANRFSDQRFVRFSLSASQQERVTDETHTGLRAIVSWRPQVEGLASLALEGGFDHERQDNTSLRYTTSERVRTAQTRDQAWQLSTTGVFLQAVLEPFAGLKLVPGYRIDRLSGDFSNRLAGTSAGINDYGNILQPKISAVWEFRPGTSAYANWGRTFQVGVGAATFKIPPRTSDLKASVNDGAELGLKFALGGAGNGRVALWQQTATDEVYRDLNNPSGDSTNIGATRRRGLDVQLRAAASNTLDVHATLSLQQAIITTPNPAAPLSLGKDVDHVPRRLYTAGVDWQWHPALRLSAWLQGQSSYWLERTNTLTGRYGAHTTANLGLAWQQSPNLQWDVQLLNATDTRREYVWWDGAQTLHSPGEPRSLHLSLRASF